MCTSISPKTLKNLQRTSYITLTAWSPWGMQNSLRYRVRVSFMKLPMPAMSSRKRACLDLPWNIEVNIEIYMGKYRKCLDFGGFVRILRLRALGGRNCRDVPKRNSRVRNGCRNSHFICNLPWWCLNLFQDRILWVRPIITCLTSRSLIFASVRNLSYHMLYSWSPSL